MDTRYSYATKLVLIVLFFMGSVVASSQQLDTLRNYSGGDVFYYVVPSTSLYAQKYQVFRELSIRSVGVCVYGKLGSSCRLRLFGHEGGANIPLFQNDLIEPISITKSKIGLETIWVELSSPLQTKNNNFYIVIDSLSDGLYVLADKSKKHQLCSEFTYSESAQYLKSANDEWKKTDSPLLVDVVVEYPNNHTHPLFSLDSTSFKALKDDLHGHNQDDNQYTGLTCGDINNDGYTDILMNSKVWINQKGTGFTENSSEYYFPSGVVSQMLLDVDNNGNMEIVSIAKQDSASVLHISHGNLKHQNISVLLPLNYNDSPTSFSIADYNADGYLDIFVGVYSKYNHPKHILLRNNRSGTFTSELISSSLAFNCAGSVAYDKDQDGDIDVVIADADSRDLVWMMNDGKGNFISIDFDSDLPQATRGEALSGVSGYKSRGLHIRDINGDGYADVFQPYHAEKQSEISGETRIARVSNSAINTVTELEEMQSGGAWGDYDNDTYEDFIATTSCGCRYADVYRNIKNVKFEMMTSSLGLEKISNTHEAVWCDIDNDGLLDLIVPHTNLPRLYRQSKQATSRNNYANIRLSSSGNKPVAGSTVSVFSDGRQFNQTVNIGRGLLIQDPAELHYGLGEGGNIDSVIVQWSNKPSELETFKGITSNKNITLTQGSGMTKNKTEGSGNLIDVYPNPFTKTIKIEFDVQYESECQVNVYDVNGVIVSSLLTKQLLQPKRYALDWDGINQQGLIVPTGVYVVRLTLGNTIYSERVVRVE